MATIATIDKCPYFSSLDMPLSSVLGDTVFPYIHMPPKIHSLIFPPFLFNCRLLPEAFNVLLRFVFTL